MSIEDLVLIDYSPEEGSRKSVESAFQAMLIEWAKKLPDSPLGIIDLAAGVGYEARILDDYGFSVVAQDPSEALRKRGVARIIPGTAEKLGFPKNQFGGALLKDSLIFLSEKKRLRMLQELNRVLVDRGSLMVASENNAVHRARLSDSGNVISVTDLDKGGSIDLWEEEVFRLCDTGAVPFSIEYPASLELIESNFNRYGFTVTESREYDTRSVMAQQNSWVRRPGFIAVLKLRKRWG